MNSVNNELSPFFYVALQCVEHLLDSFLQRKYTYIVIHIFIYKCIYRYVHTYYIYYMCSSNAFVAKTSEAYEKGRKWNAWQYHDSTHIHIHIYFGTPIYVYKLSIYVCTTYSLSCWRFVSLPPEQEAELAPVEKYLEFREDCVVTFRDIISRATLPWKIKNIYGRGILKTINIGK